MVISQQLWDFALLRSSCPQEFSQCILICIWKIYPASITQVIIKETSDLSGDFQYVISLFTQEIALIAAWFFCVGFLLFRGSQNEWGAIKCPEYFCIKYFFLKFFLVKSSSLSLLPFCFFLKKSWNRQHSRLELFECVCCRFFFLTLFFHFGSCIWQSTWKSVKDLAYTTLLWTVKFQTSLKYCVYMNVHMYLCSTCLYGFNLSFVNRSLHPCSCFFCPGGFKVDVVV